LRRTFPLPVILILFAKPLWVFCLGIFLIPFAYCSLFHSLYGKPGNIQE
jgi:hypothetical protein